jgi:outer membrane lipoprotein-sorting protein
LVLATLGWVATAEAQTLDEILARHAEALGGIESLRAIRSVRMSGRVTAGGGREALVAREVQRPDRVRTEFTYQGVTGVYAFDGERGWKVSPFDGSLAPEPMPDEEARQTADQADIEGPLVDWQAKGHRVSLSGKESLDGREAYKLEITLRNGRELYQYVDAESFLLVRTDTTRFVLGHPVAIETSFDDYREVGGVRFPHLIETSAVGRPQHLRIVVEEVEVNPTLDDARFEMPILQP